MFPDHLQPAVILVYCNTDFEVLIHAGRADQGRAVRSAGRLQALGVGLGPSWGARGVGGAQHSASPSSVPGAGSSGMRRSFPAARRRERAPALLSQGSAQLSGAAWSQSSCPLSAIRAWASSLERALPSVRKCLKKSVR